MLLEVDLLSKGDRLGNVVMSQDLIALLKQYARRGIQDWKSERLNAEQKQAKEKARLTLNHARIIEAPEQADIFINNVVKDAKDGGCKFIPMPTINHDKIKRCFFSVRLQKEGKTAFDLLLFIDDEKWLGFRFEPADSERSSHGYGHVQMNRAMCGGNHQIKGIPEWLPDSYPAFPLPTSEPLKMFLSMAVSVHGFGHGYEGGVTEIINACKNPVDKQRFKEVLKDMFSRLD